MTLHRLPAGMARPRYDLGRVEGGVLHLGLGNFHRAHQAVVFEDLLSAGDLRWGVCGLSLRSAAMQAALTPQDGLYTLLVRDGTGTQARVIGAVREAMRAGPGAADPVARLATPGIRLVTLTITEKGYDEDGPGSALSALVQGLAARRNAGLGGLTLLSCDNLSGNGERLSQRLLQVAGASDAALADWIAAQVICPNSMVDRIVPATTDFDREEALQLTGLEDAWPVVAEPFSQWVIEARGEWPPSLQAAPGVEWVDAVAPWEAMKLRLLNAAHSTLAYLGALVGFRTVDEAIADPFLRALVVQLWAEAIPTLPAAVRAQAPAYTARLLARFENPALHHRLLQISADGSRKLPPRLLATLGCARRNGAPTDALVLAVAAWIRFCEGVDDRGVALPLDDPLAASLRRAASQTGTALDTVAAMLALDPAFAPGAADARVVQAIANALQALRQDGAARAVRACLRASAQRLSSTAVSLPLSR